MGMSSTAKLAYGFDLGGDEDGWNLPNLDYGQWRPPELTEDEEDEFDFAEWVEDKLLVDAGFTETDDEDDGYFTRKRAVRSQLGVQVISSGNHDYFRHLLVAWNETGLGSDPTTIDLVELERRRVEEGWDAKLFNAARALGMPKIMVPSKRWDEELAVEQKPHWMLTAFYG
jgi:hypothetical protein